MIVLARTGMNAFGDSVSTASDVQTALNAVAANTLSPADFLAAGQTATQLYTGAIDAQPILTAYVAAGCLSPLPSGTYTLNSPLLLAGQSLRGGDRGGVTLNIAFASGDGIVLSGTRPALRNVRVTAAASRTNGAAVRITNSYGAVAEDLAFEGSHQEDAILVDGANTTHISRLDVRPSPSAGPTGFAAGSGIRLLNMAVDTHIVGVNIAQWHYGLRLSDASGVFVSNVDVVRAGMGIFFDPTASQQVFGVQMSTVLGDTSAGDNWYFGGTGPITDVQITNLWASNSQTATGVAVVNSNVNGLSISNPHVLGNFGHGITLPGGKNIAITGGSVTDNSAAGSALWDGINSVGGADQVRIVGVMSGAGGSFSRPSPGPAQPNLQRYGINLGTGSNDTRRMIVGFSQFLGNVTSGLVMPTGLNIVNLGNTQ